MFLKKLEIENYKKLEKLDIVFNKVEPLDKLRTTIIIGENGTAKTTIFEYIIKNFNYLIENNYFEIEKLESTKVQNIRLIVSSYAAIDKLNTLILENENFEDRYDVEVIRTSKVVGNLSGLINRMIELMYKEKFEKGNMLRFLLEYIGYKPYNVYLIHTKSKFKSFPALIRKSSACMYNVKEEWLEYPNANFNDIDKIQMELEIFCDRMNDLHFNNKNIEIDISIYLKEL